MLRNVALAGALAACLAAGPASAQHCGRLLTLLDADRSGLTAVTLHVLPRGGGMAIDAGGGPTGLPPAQHCELNSADGDNELRCQWEYPAQDAATAAFDGLLARMRRCLGAGSMAPGTIFAGPSGWRPVQRNEHEIERAEGGTSRIELELIEYIAQPQAGAPPPAAVYYVELGVLRGSE